MRSADLHLLAACGVDTTTPSRVHNCFEELYDYLQKQSCTVFVANHAILCRIRRLLVLRRIHRLSRYFAAYLPSVTLLHAQQICVITKAYRHTVKHRRRTLLCGYPLCVD
jgi:hypothetical protein